MAAYAERDFRGFYRLLFLTFVGIVALGIVCAIGLDFLGPLLLTLVYGESSLDYVYLLQPLVLCAVVTGVGWFINDLLIAIRNFKSTLVGSLVGLGASLIVMAPFQAFFELNAVTMTNIFSGLLSSAFMLVCLALQIKKWIKG